MIFLNDIWLYLTPLAVCLVGGLVVYGMRRRDSLLGQFAAARLLGTLTNKAQTNRLWIKATCVLIGVALICISLARPQYGVEWIERKAKGLDIIFVLDSSKSMLATDLRPTRLDRAKLAIIDLVERLESDRIGLVAFSGRAFLQTPPTLDYSAFMESLDSINTQTISSGGSDLGGAITEAANAFPQANNYKVVVLLTDGEDLGGRALEVAEKVKDDNVQIYAIGLGTPEGEYLRVRNEEGVEEFVRDAEGQPVRSQLDESTLTQLASITGGRYARLGGGSLDTLYNSVLATLPREERESEMQEARIDRYQWPLALGLAFLIIDFIVRRRGSSQALILTFLLVLCLQPKTMHAQTEEISEVASQEESLLPVESDDARELYNSAHDLIQEGQFTKAKEVLGRSVQNTADLKLQRDALYNSAHSIFQEGEQAFSGQDFQAAIDKWKEAEALFKSAHSIDNQDTQALEDATLVEARRKALEDFLEQQQQNQEQQQTDDSQENNESSKENSESESEQSESGENGDSSEQNEDSQEQSEQNQGSENEDSDSSESQQNQQSENGEDSQESGNQQNSDQEAGDNNQSGDTNEEEDTESEQTGAEESTEEDSDQNQANQQASNQNQEGDETGQNSQATEGDLNEAMGMSAEQAALLLDSLRDGEKLLPFMEQSTPQNNQQNKQDW